MNAKTTKVMLVVPQHNVKREFEISHAERILRMPNNGGWTLPDDSKYIFVDDGIRLKTNKKADRK